MLAPVSPKFYEFYCVSKPVRNHQPCSMWGQGCTLYFHNVGYRLLVILFVVLKRLNFKSRHHVIINLGEFGSDVEPYPIDQKVPSSIQCLVSSRGLVLCSILFMLCSTNPPTTLLWQAKWVNSAKRGFG